MSHIEKTLDRIASMTAKQRATLRGNATAILARNGDDAGARQILAALDAHEAATPQTHKFEVTGLLSWEKYRPRQPSFCAFHDGAVVGRVFMRANHSQLDKEVYALEMLGEAIAGEFHHIRDARAAGEQAFAARRDQQKWRENN